MGGALRVPYWVAGGGESTRGRGGNGLGLLRVTSVHDTLTASARVLARHVNACGTVLACRMRAERCPRLWLCNNSASCNRMVDSGPAMAFP